MRRARRIRWSLLLAGVLAVPLLSGCAVLSFPGSGGGGVGTVRHSIQICASGQKGSYPCRDQGNIKLDATSGFRQLLLGAQIPAGVGAPESIVTPAPSSTTFASSPGYAAELQRLQPAPAGRKWVGWISPSLNYDADNDTVFAQRLFATADWQLPHGADGSPYAAGSLTSHWVVGVRNVTSAATAGRPVVCGDSLTTAFKDVDDAGNPGFVFRLDSQLDVTSGAADLGVVTTGARASGAPGSLVSMPFILRSGGADFGITPLTSTATTTLAGATIAVTPDPLPQPQKNGDVTAIAAVGIPAGAAPGVYDVTFTANLIPYGPGVTRTGVGKLTVLPAPPGAGGTSGTGSTPAKRKVTTILPRGLTLASALAGGIPVLIGSTVAGPAVVRLQQGPKKTPTVSVGKRLRLKAPGPVKVTLRSRKLAQGPYRITVSVSGKVVKTVSGRLTIPRKRR